MRITSPRLRRLDNALAWLPAESEAMMLGELDGYLAGIIVCPEPIPPHEWLPSVWTGNDGDGTPFADAREADWHNALVEEHYEAITRTLNKGAGRYAPFFEVDARHDEILWEMWIEGFARAAALRRDSLARIVESGDADAADALALLFTLGEIAQDASDLERMAIDALTGTAHVLIGPAVETLYQWRLAQKPTLLAPPGMARPASAKIGRNDPCPCGSGRKHKKCCGAG